MVPLSGYMHFTPAALEAAIGLLNKPGPAKTGPVKAGHYDRTRGEIVEAAGNRA
jgi:hypothetical protein